MRKYSLSEIDLMRATIRRIMDCRGVQIVSVNQYVGAPYREAERVREVEERLRTYMMNETGLEELLVEERRLREDIDRRMDAYKEQKVG